MIEQLKSFKAKIFLALIIISLIPLLIIASVNLWLVVETRQKNIAELQNLAISNASAETKKFLNQKIEALNLVVSGAATAEGAPVASIAEIDPNTLAFLMRQVKAAIKEAKEIVFIDRGAVAVRLDEDGQISIGEDYAAGGLTDPAVEVAETLDTSAGESELYQIAASGKNYFGPVEYEDGFPAMRLASQIENQYNQVIGVIAATVDLSPLHDLINRIKLGQSGYVYLTDASQRLIISSSDKFAIPGESLAEPPQIADVVAGNIHDGLIKFETFKNALGQKMIFAGRPMGMINWFVMSEWPRGDAYAVINDILARSLLVIAIALLAVLASSWLLARQIVKPIKVLGKAAKEISEGNLAYEVKLKTNDEFDLLGEKFNQMTRVLKENKELRDEFVFVAAHELRTPVTAIKGYLSMMLDGSLGRPPEKMTEPLKVVFAANERLVQLVQDLLEIARSESGKMVIEVKPLSLDKAVSLVAKELASLADPKGIKIKYQAPAGELKVLADDYKLKEVLTNLIGNAVKYTVGSGDIEISHETAGDEVVTHVKDHGLGMSEEAQKKLFSKFYRVKTDQTAKIEGTGLGLFICKEIVERMGGRIWAESKEGAGSTFSFSLKKA